MPSLSDDLANAYSAPNQLPLRPVRRALISVSDKSGIANFAKSLHDRGVALLSTGGTAKLIAEAGLPVTEVSEHTGFPEMMDGRVKTLHPKIHGGLLGRRDMDEAIMAEHGIDPIDMLVVNLYPFASTVADPNCPLPLAIENIDIGGPAMLRAAAKNNDGAAVVIDPSDYVNLLAEMDANNNQLTGATRFKLAAKTYAHTAAYDGAIANYMGRIADDGSKRDWPDTFSSQFELEESLRYGENPHQKAAFFKEAGASEPAIGTATQIQGKALSYNNLADADAALECVKAFPEAPACVIVKHANPCGVALGDSLLQAYDLAFKTDPTSAFGGIIAFNQALDAETAKAIVDRQFVEVIIAPSVDADAAKVLSAKANVRVLETGMWDKAQPSYDFKRINGGLLVQDRDLGSVSDDDLKIVTKRAPTDDEMRDLKFVWRVAKFVKSNAIVYAKGQQTIGVGAGQMSRVYSAKIAGIKAADEGLEVPGSVLASDAFFPFRDGVDAAAAAGITAMIQPGGSIRDEEVIAAADEANIAMVFTGMRHFKH